MARVVVKAHPKFNPITMDYSSIENDKPKTSRYAKVSSGKHASIDDAISKLLRGDMSGVLNASDEYSALPYLPEGLAAGNYMPIKVSLPNGYVRALDRGAPAEAYFNIEPYSDTGSIMEDYARKGLAYGPDFYRYITKVLPDLAASQGKIPLFVGDVSREKVERGLPTSVNNLNDFDAAVRTGSMYKDPRVQAAVKLINTDQNVFAHDPRLSNMLTAILNKSHDFSPLLAPELDYVGKELNDVGAARYNRGLPVDENDPTFWKASDVSFPITMLDKATGEKVKRFIPGKRIYNSPLYNWNTNLWRNNPDAVTALLKDDDYQRNWSSWGIADMYAEDGTGLPAIKKQEAFDKFNMPQPTAVNKPLDYDEFYSNLTAQGRYFPDVFNAAGGPQAYALQAIKRGIPIHRQSNDFARLLEAKNQHSAMSNEELADIAERNAITMNKNSADLGGTNSKYKAVFKGTDDEGKADFGIQSGKARHVNRRMFFKNMFSEHEKNADQLNYLHSLGLNADEDIAGLREWTASGEHAADAEGNTGKAGPGAAIWNDYITKYSGAALAKQIADAYAAYKTEHKDEFAAKKEAKAAQQKADEEAKAKKEADIEALLKRNRERLAKEKGASNETEKAEIN